MSDYIVVNKDGLNVRSQMSTTNDKNLLRRMSKGEGFEVQQTYNVPGMTGLQVWGRLSNNPGGIRQEYVCLQIGNKKYAEEEKPSVPVYVPIDAVDAWRYAVDAWIRLRGYDGPRP